MTNVACPRLLMILSLLVVLASELHAHELTEIQRTSLADSLIAAFASENALPALTVAAAANGQIVYSNAIGFSDLENNVAADEETVFRIASVTKPLTATAVAKLAQDDKLDLDVPIDRYCPAYRVHKQAPTARQLLAHLGGVADYNRIERGIWKVTTTGGTVLGSNPFYFASLSDAVTAVATDSLISQPGKEYHYSNVGYVLLGCAIEGASGLAYDEFMRREIFQPAGMTRTQPDDAYRIISNRARPYQGRTEKNESWWWWTPVQKEVMEVGVLYNARFEDTSMKRSAGGLLSTARDLVRFAIAFYNDTLIDEQMRAQMLTLQETTSGEQTSWGLGWSMGDVDGEYVVGLSGGQPGASAVLRTIPEDGFAIAAITNRDLVSLGPLVKELGQLWGHFDVQNDSDK